MLHCSVRRSHHEHRLAVVGQSRPELAEKLAALPAARHPRLFSGRSSLDRCRASYLYFPGKGAMGGYGRELLAQSPVFREALERCNQAMQSYVDWSLLDQIAADEPDSRLNEIDVVQPVLFAIQVALATLWRSWGIEPDAVVGHSMGEVAAAHVAGALSLQMRAHHVLRSSLLRRVSGEAYGRRRLSLAQAEEALDATRNAFRLPSATARSQSCQGTRRLWLSTEYAYRSKHLLPPDQVDVASHSPQMDPYGPTCCTL